MTTRAMNHSPRIFACALLIAACGDDARPTIVDGGSTVHADSRPLTVDSQPLTADAAVPVADAAPRRDQALHDATVTTDQLAPPDVVYLGPASVTGEVSVSATAVTCSTATATADCIGALYIGVLDRPAAPPEATLLATVTIDGADLSGGKSVSYTIEGLTGGATVYVAAMLAESGQLPTPPFPAASDLVIGPQPVLLAGPANPLDLALDSRWTP